MSNQNPPGIIYIVTEEDTVGDLWVDIAVFDRQQAESRAKEIRESDKSIVDAYVTELHWEGSLQAYRQW